MTNKLSSLIECDRDNVVEGIYTNSSQVVPGGMFVALRGERVNGEDFINDAISNGAKFIVKLGPVRTIYDVNGVIFIENPEPRKLLAVMCTKFYKNSLEHIAIVTGTNGKTSTVDFLRQLWRSAGYKSAGLGTLGVRSDLNVKFSSSLTSPEQITLNRLLADLSHHGCQNVALEASSHGIDQYRMFGIKLDVIAFTNFSQDHLDYHKTMEEYWNAKCKLFKEYPSENTKYVINADSDRFDELSKLCRCVPITYGLSAGDFRFEDISPRQNGYDARLMCFGEAHDVQINIASEFQLYNILCAAAMAYATGLSINDIVCGIPKLIGVKGRMQLVGRYNGAGIYVDYAHTPDALRTALQDIKHRTSGRTMLIFGCGGDRDRSKRRLMGKVATEYADVVIVTDDNPRTETPDMIRKSIIEGCPNATEIADRRKAINYAVGMLKESDSLLIAGKGHEDYQIIGNRTEHFDDAEEVEKIIKLFSADEVNSIFGSSIENDIYGVSVNSRDVIPGDLFVAIKGEHFDGNNFVSNAFDMGASAALVSDHGICRQNVIKVDDTVSALHKLGEYSRRRTKATVIGVTGSVGKSSTKNMLSLVLNKFAGTFSSLKNFNSQIGLPICLSMIPKEVNYAVLEMGMSHKGDLYKLTQIADQDVSIVTNISESHCEFFDSVSDIALAKSEIFANGKRQKFALIPSDSTYSSILMQQAKSYGVKDVYTFGEGEGSDAYITDMSFDSGRTHICANILGASVKYIINSVNKGIICDSLVPILCAKLLGHDVYEAADAISEFLPLAGRGRVSCLINDSVMIDDSYNASPASMRASIETLKRYVGFHKIAILGDMGELGEGSIDMHCQLAEELKDIDEVYLCGKHMKFLHGIVKSEWFDNYHDLLPKFNLLEHSAVLIKASRFMQLDKVSEFILNKYGKK